MLISRISQAAVTAGLVALTAVTAQGQGYRPSSPTISPWLNLYQKKGGPLDNYHMFVQPEMQLRDTLQQQQSDIQRQTAGLSTLGRQVTQIEQNRNRPVAPTGQGAGFMNHGQFFGAQATTGGGRGAAAGRRPSMPSAGRRP